MSNTAKKLTNHQTVMRLCITAMLIALAAVLSMVKIYKLPLGGAITLFSMVPITFIAVKYGNVWGLFSSFVYSLIQFLFAILFDGIFAWGLTPEILVGAIFFDYIFAFTALGLAGVFRKKGDMGVILGIVLSMSLRFISHFLSGIIFFQSFEVFNNPYIYSLAYNGSYMLPELIMTTAMVIFLVKNKEVKKFFEKF